MYCPRLLHQTLARALTQFPAVLITGPRQSGKTTFLREEFGRGARYVTFDEPLAREFARSDPEGFLDQLGEETAILDEVQYVPDLFQHLKIRIDRDRRRNGRWILTGSQQFGLMAGVSESLAGRITLLDLFPFSLLETGGERAADLPSVIWNGSYPEPALFPEKRDLWISSYLRTYVERDVRQLHNVQDLHAFETFVALCATRHGQELNRADLSRAAGVSQPTVKTWTGVLEAAYVAYLLPPFFENFGKRLIRTPKFYLVDSALVCALTRQPSAEAALAGAMGGALFEGLVVSEAIKVFAIEGKRPDLFFWRSQSGLEVDLLLRRGDRLVPIEIKLTATPTARHAQPLRHFRRLADGAAEGGLVICRVPERRSLPHGDLALPWQEFPAWMREQIAGDGGS